MAELGIAWEREQVGRVFRHTQHIRPICYDDAGTLRRIVSTWANSGIAERPHIVTASRMMVSVADDGMRRIHPTRELDRYMEIGTPYVKVGGVWRKVGFTGATRTGNRITWHRDQADLRITHGGHFIKLDIELLGGYVPEDRLIAFPVGLTGLTRSGAAILEDGETVALLRAPVVTDASNPEDVRPIAYRFTALNSQPYLVMTLPSLTGMTRPVIDPTLTLQPDAASGVDALIYGAADTFNYGVFADLVMGWRRYFNAYRALLKFDLSSIAASATVTSAILTLYMSAETSTRDTTMAVYRQKRAWVEGTNNGVADSPATGVTWNRYDTTNNWSTAGGFHADDCEQTDIGTKLYDDAEAAGAKDFTLTAAKVGEWVSGAFANNGILIKSTDTEGADANSYYTHSSSDHGTEAQRPKLVVEYTAPTNTPQAAAGAQTNTGVITRETATSRAGGAWSGTGTIGRGASTTKGGAWSGVGGLVRRIGKTLAGAWSGVGGLVRRIGKTLAGAWSGVGGLVRRIGKTLVGTWSGAGDIGSPAITVIGIINLTLFSRSVTLTLHTRGVTLTVEDR